MQSLDLKELKKQLTNANIVIVTHMSPDGDAVGSSLAIYHYLQKLGNNVTVIVPDAYPANFKFLSVSDKILNFA
ncbi:MAG: DHH family phosphoesterase [Solitalea-like symbiont of Acarus siro]